MQAVLDFEDFSPKEKVFREGLREFVPLEALPYIARYFASKEVKLKVTKSRKTKYGDFRTSPLMPVPLITINHDLNPYAFLITLVHEAAHLECWIRHKNRVKPHGKEWKGFFRELMKPYVHLHIFPKEILLALNNYLENPAASSCSDIALMKALKCHDKFQEEVVHLEDLPEDGLFLLNDRMFKKGVKRRKLFKCQDLGNRKFYLINPVCEVVPINQTNS